LFWIILLISLPLLACTSFVLNSESPYLAKNLDWEIDRGYLFYNLDGIEKNSISDTSLAWISKYKSITNNQFGKEFPLGGMNEAGLVIEELSLFGQSYQCDTSKMLLNEFQWVQYQLDMSKTVEEVIQSLENITITHDIMNLHYIIADKTGDIAVVECLENGVVVHWGEMLPYPVLSNNPYVEAMRYLGFFKGYGGEMEVQHRQGSQERFVSCVHLLNDKYVATDPVSYAFDLLDTVRQRDTQWQFVYDIADLKVICHIHINTKPYETSFRKLKKVKHNQYAVPLYQDRYKKIRMTNEVNREQLDFINKNLDNYFPGKKHVYDLMMGAGEKSLKQK